MWRAVLLAMPQTFALEPEIAAILVDGLAEFVDFGASGVGGK